MEDIRVETLKKVDDKTLVKDVLSGKTERYEGIIRKYNQRLYRVGLGYLTNDADVEDAMQNTYLKAYEKLSTFKWKSQLFTWLTRIMINECLMIIKQQKRQNDNLSKEEDKPDFNTPERQLINDEMKTQLENAIKTLPQNFRSVYIMREVEQMSVADTADFLSLSTDNVKVLLHRAKKQLKNTLYQYAQPQDTFDFHLSKCNKLTNAVLVKLFS